MMKDKCNWVWTKDDQYDKYYFVADCGFKAPSIVTIKCPKCGKEIDTFVEF